VATKAPYQHMLYRYFAFPHKSWLWIQATRTSNCPLCLLLTFLDLSTQMLVLAIGYTEEPKAIRLEQPRGGSKTSRLVRHQRRYTYCGRCVQSLRRGGDGADDGDGGDGDGDYGDASLCALRARLLLRACGPSRLKLLELLHERVE